MRRLDIVRFPAGGGNTPFAMVVQADDFDALSTLLVAPVLPAEERTILPEIEIEWRWNEQSYVIQLHDIAAVQKSRLGALEANLDHMEFDISRALDRLFFGV